MPIPLEQLISETEGDALAPVSLTKGTLRNLVLELKIRRDAMAPIPSRERVMTALRNLDQARA